jgi:anthranilate 1,2-dioxygenase small subunit
MTIQGATTKSKTNTSDELMLRFEVDDFNTRYANVLDQGDLLDWPKFFANEPFYKITSRENFSGTFPIGIMYCDSKMMLEDRVTSILTSMEFSPRILTHFISGLQLIDVTPAAFSARSNFLLIENMIDQRPSILMVGQYYDKFIREGDALVLKERICVYDSILIKTSIIFPV